MSLFFFYCIRFAGCSSYLTKVFLFLQGRLPVLCWFNFKKGNFIMRCAQPKTGPAFKVQCSIRARSFGTIVE